MEQLTQQLFAPMTAASGSSATPNPARCGLWQLAQSMLIFPGCRAVQLSSSDDVYHIPPALTLAPSSGCASRRYQYYSVPYRLDEKGPFVSKQLQRALVRESPASAHHAKRCFDCKTNKCKHTVLVSEYRKRIDAAAADARRVADEQAVRPPISFGRALADDAAVLPDSSFSVPQLSKATKNRLLDLGTTIRNDVAIRNLSPAEALQRLVPFPLSRPPEIPTLCRWRRDHKCACKFKTLCDTAVLCDHCGSATTVAVQGPTTQVGPVGVRSHILSLLHGMPGWCAGHHFAH